MFIHIFEYKTTAYTINLQEKQRFFEALYPVFINLAKYVEESVSISKK
jgi:hypothetical protein